MRIYFVTAEPNNFVPQQLAKAAEAAGLEAQIIDIKHLILTEGIGESKIWCAKEDQIEELPVDAETFVIPRLNEHHLDIKLSMLQRMVDMGAKLLNSVESMDLCNDKLMTHVKLNTAGIKSPFTFVVPSSDKDLEKTVAWAEETGKLKYPVVLKTLRGTHGIGVMKIDSRASFVSVAQTLQKSGMDFIVQEFIEHEQSARLIMIGDKMLAANLRGQPKDKGEFRTNSHLGSETVQYQPSQAEIDLGARIVQLFGCNFCAIDYLVKKGDGEDELIILEVNGSPGLEAIQKNWPDKNLAADVISYFTNAQSAEVPATTDQATSPVEPSSETPPVAAVEEPPPAPEVQAQDLPATEDPEEVDDDAEPTPQADGTVGGVETVTVHRILDDGAEARVDTGAKISSIHADKVEFDDSGVRLQRGDTTYHVPLARTIKIKNVHGGEASRRPIIKLDVTMKGKRFNGVEFTVNDRSNMKYQVLIGRNVLELLGMPIELPKMPDPQEPETQIDVKK